MSDQDHMASSTGLFATVFQQNWENVRGIKSERIWFLNTLRLKAELEECLDKIQTMVARAQIDEFVALGRPEGELLRYPAFRWVFPIFYFFGTTVFVGLLVYRLAAGGQP